MSKLQSLTTEIKICGLTRLEDARLCADLGVEAVGINFWPGTPRCCSLEVAAEIVEAVGEQCTVVGVFVDAPEAEIRATLSTTGIDWVQLHGDEPPELVQAFLPTAYKALRVADCGITEFASTFPGEHLLLDAAVPGQVGGTGTTFDWALARDLAQTRKLTLAGGLRPGNVANAIETVAPFRVDVASGVESQPGVKDAVKVEAFVTAVRSFQREST